MSFTKEHVNDFFQVKKKLDLDDTNQLDIPKINIQDVKVLETIPEVLENQDESLGQSRSTFECARVIGVWEEWLRPPSHRVLNTL